MASGPSATSPKTPPPLRMTGPKIRRLEPYCYGQFTEGPASKHFGRSQVHWLTGTASTVMVGCVEGILGLRPDLMACVWHRLSPANGMLFPSRRTSGAIAFTFGWENPDHRESGCRSLTLNGQTLPENYIPAALLKDENDIVLTL